MFLISTSMPPISYTKDWRYDTFYGRIHLWYPIVFKYWILSHQLRCWYPKQYIKEENNVVADALSCLPQHSISCHDSLYSFYSLVECHESDHKTTLPHHFHPLSYLHLETAIWDSMLQSPSSLRNRLNKWLIGLPEKVSNQYTIRRKPFLRLQLLERNYANLLALMQHKDLQ